MGPANLAFSENWSSFSDITVCNVKNLINMQKDLNNEIGYQIRNTIIRTKNLLTKIDFLYNNSQNHTLIPWYLVLFYTFSHFFHTNKNTKYTAKICTTTYIRSYKEVHINIFVLHS